MPNWTINSIYVRGSTQNIYDFIQKYKIDVEKNVFSFDNIIPEPKSANDCPVKYHRKDGDHIEIDSDKPWFNWYEWHIDNWGTKWDACDVSINIDNGGLEIEFSTAWCHPEPIFKALKKENPHLRIMCDYTDEGDW